MYALKDKIVLITGGANGIGAAIVTEFVQQKIKRVIILDVDQDAGVSLQSKLNYAHGDIVKFIKCDVADEDQLFSAFDRTVQEDGYIDVVINNAAIIDESNYDMIRRQIGINVTAVVNGTLKALELMRIDKSGRGGTVINMSSIAALIKHSPLLFVYTATKSAVMQFSNCIGKEPYCLKTGVRVITMCFGNTQTNIFDNMNSFDESINLKEILSLFTLQSVESAARGTIEAFKNGESGSTWLIHNGKPAQDITSNVNKAFGDLSKLL